MASNPLRSSYTNPIAAKAGVGQDKFDHGLNETAAKARVANPPQYVKEESPTPSEHRVPQHKSRHKNIVESIEQPARKRQKTNDVDVEVVNLISDDEEDEDDHGTKHKPAMQPSTTKFKSDALMLDPTRSFVIKRSDLSTIGYESTPQGRMRPVGSGPPKRERKSTVTEKADESHAPNTRVEAATPKKRLGGALFQPEDNNGIFIRQEHEDEKMQTDRQSLSLPSNAGQSLLSAEQHVESPVLTDQETNVREKAKLESKLRREEAWRRKNQGALPSSNHLQLKRSPVGNTNRDLPGADVDKSTGKEKTSSEQDMEQSPAALDEKELQWRLLRYGSGFVGDHQVARRPGPAGLHHTELGTRKPKPKMQLVEKTPVVLAEVPALKSHMSLDRRPQERHNHTDRRREQISREQLHQKVQSEIPDSDAEGCIADGVPEISRMIQVSETASSVEGHRRSDSVLRRSSMLGPRVGVDANANCSAQESSVEEKAIDVRTIPSVPSSTGAQSVDLDKPTSTAGDILPAPTININVAKNTIVATPTHVTTPGLSVVPVDQKKSSALFGELLEDAGRDKTKLAAFRGVSGQTWQKPAHHSASPAHGPHKAKDATRQEGTNPVKPDKQVTQPDRQPTTNQALSAPARPFSDQITGRQDPFPAQADDVTRNPLRPDTLATRSVSGSRDHAQSHSVVGKQHGLPPSTTNADAAFHQQREERIRLQKERNARNRAATPESERELSPAANVETSRGSLGLQTAVHTRQTARPLGQQATRPRYPDNGTTAGPSTQDAGYLASSPLTKPNDPQKHVADTSGPRSLASLARQESNQQDIASAVKPQHISVSNAYSPTPDGRVQLSSVSTTGDIFGRSLQTKTRKANHEKKLGTITQQDATILLWRKRDGWSPTEIAARFFEVFGVRRASETLRKRCGLVARSLQAKGIFDVQLIEDLANGDQSAYEKLNILVYGSSWSPSAGPSKVAADASLNWLQGRRRRPEKLPEDGRHERTAMKTSRRSPVHSDLHFDVGDNSPLMIRDSFEDGTTTRTTSESGDEDDTYQTSQEIQPSYPYPGGKTIPPVVKHWIDASTAHRQEYEDAGAADALLQDFEEDSADDSGSEFCEEDYVHNTYTVQRRDFDSDEVTAEYFDDGDKIYDKRWHDCSDPHEDLHEANIQAQAYIGKLPSADRWTLDSTLDEHGFRMLTWKHDEHGWTQMRVVKRMRTRHDRIRPRSKSHWAPKRIWFVRMKILRRVQPTEEDALFEEPQWSLQKESTTGEVYTSIELANDKAIELFVNRTSVSAKLADRDEATRQLREQYKLGDYDDVEHDDEHIVFDRFKEVNRRNAQDGEELQRVRVWVEEGQLKGPRNL